MVFVQLYQEVYKIFFGLPVGGYDWKQIKFLPFFHQKEWLSQSFALLRSNIQT